MAKSIPVLEGVTASPPDPLQETSLEIWDSKYRLKSKDGAPSTVHRRDLPACRSRAGCAGARTRHLV